VKGERGPRSTKGNTKNKMVIGAKQVQEKSERTNGASKGRNAKAHTKKGVTKKGTSLGKKMGGFRSVCGGRGWGGVGRKRFGVQERTEKKNSFEGLKKKERSHKHDFKKKKEKKGTNGTERSKGLRGNKRDCRGNPGKGIKT